jgi:RecB family endonuclease NucS
MGEARLLEKDGVEADSKRAGRRSRFCGEGLRLVTRGLTDIGPVDLMCRDEAGFAAVEVKRIATIEAVEQLARYLERLRAEPGLACCRGVSPPSAMTAGSNARPGEGDRLVEVDLEVCPRRARARARCFQPERDRRPMVRAARGSRAERLASLF